MATLTSRALVASAMAIAATACETPESVTGLRPEGPPTIMQVFLSERSMDGRSRKVLGYGRHDGYAEAQTHKATTALTRGQNLRVVVDELLIGNYLEEIKCQPSRTLADGSACIVDGGYSRVPEGATPDDIANCAVADDVLESTCKGPHAVCLNAAGIPCGVEDEEDNDTGYVLRFIKGQAKLICGAFEIDMDQAQSFWQPSGNQVVPPNTDAASLLGPALVLHPISPPGVGAPDGKPGLLPSSSSCKLWLADNVTDKEHRKVCAPAILDDKGTLADDCADGDLSVIDFQTEALARTLTLVANADLSRGNTNIPLSPATITVIFNGELKGTTDSQGVTTLDGTITILEGGAPVTNFTVDPLGMERASVKITMGANFRPSTEYTVTLNVTDAYGIAPAVPVTSTFTTAAS